MAGRCINAPTQLWEGAGGGRTRRRGEPCPALIKWLSARTSQRTGDLGAVSPVSLVQSRRCAPAPTRAQRRASHHVTRAERMFHAVASVSSLSTRRIPRTEIWS